MLKFLLITSSDSLRNSLTQLVETKKKGGAVIPFSFESGADGDDNRRLEAFDGLYAKVNSEIQKSDSVHDRFIGVIDCAYADNAWGIHALTSVSGMMILAFPEIQWIPVYRDGTVGSATMNLQTAIDLCLGGYSPLFDGDGLRGILLNRVRSGPDANDLRRDVAFSVDEEANFAYINTYTAFRFGYRGFPVITGQCAEMLLKSGKRANIPCAVDSDKPEPESGKKTQPGTDRRVQSVVVFEDICLSYPDKNAGYAKNTAFGDKRDAYFKLIPDADLRIVTTAAPPGEKNAVWNDKNVTLRTYFRNTGVGSRPYKNVLDSYGGTWKQNIKIIRRRAFNYFGGKWAGYWVVNLIEFLVYFFLAIGLFMVYPPSIFVLLLFIFIRFSARNWLVDQLKLSRVPFLVKRRQWAFMPKCYVNHDPVWKNPEKAASRICRFWEVAHKPVAGIFGLRNKSGLPNGLDCQSAYTSEFVARFYRQVIRTGQYADDPGKAVENGHSAPGVAVELATRLIRRAEAMKGKVVDVESAVHAAVLADVALELLDNKTPAVSLDALYLKHRYEIVAECEFVGVRARLDMKDRYIDIHNAVGRICRADNNRVRDVIFLSGMAQIIEKISKILRDKGKLEEAAYFTTHSRRLHRKLMSPMMSTLLAYPEWALRTVGNFLFSFGGFFLLFLFYWYFTFDQPFLTSLISTYKVMVARQMEIPPVKSDQAQFIIMLARQIAVLHLGFVAAYFLMFMNRK